jgi:hypothetical protein
MLGMDAALAGYAGAMSTHWDAQTYDRASRPQQEVAPT